MGVPRTEALHAAPLPLPAGEERMQRRRCTVLRISSPVASAPSDDVGRRAKSLAAASARIRAQPDDFAARDIWLAVCVVYVVVDAVRLQE